MMTQYPSTTEPLREAFLQGDGRAQVVVFERVANAQNASEDVMQEVALRVAKLKAGGRLAPVGESLHGWVHTVVHNLKCKGIRTSMSEDYKKGRVARECADRLEPSACGDQALIENRDEVDVVIEDLLDIAKQHDSEARAFLMHMRGEKHKDISHHFGKRGPTWSFRARVLVNRLLKQKDDARHRDQ